MKSIENNWDIIYQLIEKNKINELVSYCKNLKKEDYRAIETKLIDELTNTTEASIRNTISIVLGDLKSNKSIDTMIKILNDKKIKNCATLIYALEELDCANRIVDIFHILLNGNYESKCNLYTLLEKKIKNMTQADKEKCLNDLNEKIKEVETQLEFLYDTAEEIFDVTYEE